MSRDSPKRTRVDVVAIGVSTGGPNALTMLLRQFPADLPVPLVVVQHMPPVFTKLLAERLDAKLSIQVREAAGRSEEHTSDLQSPCNLVCRLLLEKKK